MTLSDPSELLGSLWKAEHPGFEDRQGSLWKVVSILPAKSWQGTTSSIVVLRHHVSFHIPLGSNIAVNYPDWQVSRTTLVKDFEPVFFSVVESTSTLTHEEQLQAALQAGREAFES